MVGFGLVLVVLLLNLKLLKTCKSKSGALHSSNILAKVLLQKIWHSLNDTKKIVFWCERLEQRPLKEFLLSTQYELPILQGRVS